MASELQSRACVAHESISPAEYRALSAPTKKGRFGVVPKAARTVDQITFASAREAKRYSELKLLQRAGKINNLELQPQFDIAINGIHVCRYRADFRYSNLAGEDVIEDVKGRGKGGTAGDPYFRLRKRCAEAFYGVKIVEVAS